MTTDSSPFPASPVSTLAIRESPEPEPYAKGKGAPMALQQESYCQGFIGRPFSTGPTLVRVGHTQLSYNQNEKLRMLIVRKRLENKWSISEMARQLGIKQGSLSQSLSGGGFSYATALAYCRKFENSGDIESVLGKREDEPVRHKETAREKAVRMAKDAPFNPQVIKEVMLELGDEKYDQHDPDFFYQRIRDEHFRQLQLMQRQTPLGKKPRERKREEPAEAPASAHQRPRKKIANE
jgi:transcriptional regulator with XRE-family HTH domain